MRKIIFITQLLLFNVSDVPSFAMDTDLSNDFYFVASTMFSDLNQSELDELAVAFNHPENVGQSASHLISSLLAKGEIGKNCDMGFVLKILLAKHQKNPKSPGFKTAFESLNSYAVNNLQSFNEHPTKLTSNNRHHQEFKISSQSKPEGDIVIVHDGDCVFVGNIFQNATQGTISKLCLAFGLPIDLTSRKFMEKLLVMKRFNPEHIDSTIRILKHLYVPSVLEASKLGDLILNHGLENVCILPG